MYWRNISLLLHIILTQWRCHTLILHFLLIGRGTWSVCVREERRKKVFENAAGHRVQEVKERNIYIWGKVKVFWDVGLCLRVFSIGHVTNVRRAVVMFTCHSTATSIRHFLMLRANRALTSATGVLMSDFDKMCYMLEAQLFLRPQSLPHSKHSFSQEIS